MRAVRDRAVRFVRGPLRGAALGNKWSIGCLVATALLALSCRQLVGIDDRDVGRTESSGGRGGEPGSGGQGTGGVGCPPAIFAMFSMTPFPACTNCLTTHCCAELDACADDEQCPACLTGASYCELSEPYNALSACVQSQCLEVCYPEPAIKPDLNTGDLGDLGAASGFCAPLGDAVTCNPMVQSQACNWAASAACDIAPRINLGAVGYGCFLSARKHIGERCGLIEGMCHFGLTCVNYQCGRFCCLDQDCQNGRCDRAWIDYRFGGNMQPAGHSVGICVKP